MEQYKFKIAGITDCGKRRETNQDSILTLHKKIKGKECALLAVADGMGGLHHGERASRLMVSALSEWWNRQLEVLMDDADFLEIGNSITNVIYQTHIILSNQEENSGTTISLMFLCDDRYLTCHAGDSRIYRNCVDKLFQVTTDDTWVYHAFLNGEISAQEMSEHTYRHALVNAVGVGERISVQQSEGTIENNERYLICSDGLYNELSNGQIGEILDTKLSVDKKAETLLSAALSGKAGDNISIVLVE